MFDSSFLMSKTRLSKLIKEFQDDPDLWDLLDTKEKREFPISFDKFVMKSKYKFCPYDAMHNFILLDSVGRELRWTDFYLQAGGACIAHTTFSLNKVLNKLFKLAKNEIAILNLSPLRTAMMARLHLFLKIHIIEEFDQSEQNQKSSCQLTIVNLQDENLTSFVFYPLLLNCYVNTTCVPLLDCVMFEIDKDFHLSDLPMACLFVVLDGADIQLEILFDRLVELGQCRSKNKRLFIAPTSCSQFDFHCQRDFVRYIQKANMALENRAEKEFTTPADLNVEGINWPILSKNDIWTAWVWGYTLLP